MKKIENIKFEDIKADEENPRQITPEQAEQLKNSIKEFKNISQIVFNLRTNTLVSGHQRINALKELYSNLRLLKRNNNECEIIGDNKPTGFNIRFVDWDIEKQKSANLVANSPFASGSFDVAKVERLLDTYDLKIYDETFKLGDLALNINHAIDESFEGVGKEGEGQGEQGDYQILKLRCDYEVYSQVQADVQKLIDEKYKNKVTLSDK